MKDSSSAWSSVGIVTESEEMQEVLRQLSRAAPFDVPVHIRGETGTGKELAARGIHASSRRAAGGRFVPLNCAAIPDSLLEAELFGYVRGAFTGADRRREGLLAEADGGTLFLDEVADLSIRGQTALLRVLQDKRFRRLGDPRMQRSDFRLISATNKSLEDEVTGGRFRADLYFRLRVVHVELPPLRERPADIAAIARVFLRRAAERLRLPVPRMDAQAHEALARCAWPGNVRELENELLQALLRAEGASLLRICHLSPGLVSRACRPSQSLRGASEEFERSYLTRALEKHGGNRTRVARSLGLSRQGLYAKLKRLGLADGREGARMQRHPSCGHCGYCGPCGISLAGFGAAGTESQH